MSRRYSCSPSALLLPAVSAQAQWAETDVPQTFWVEIGGFRVSAETTLRLSGGGEAGDQVNFEQDLSVPGSTTQGYLEAFWRPARRHQMSLNWTRVKRNGEPRILDEEIHWGDAVFRVGAEVQGTNDSDFLSGVYRFALIKNDKFEVGPALGLGYVWISAGLSGQVGVGIGGDEFVRNVDLQSTVGSITGDLGGYLYWWAGERWLVRSDARYIFASFEESEASVTEARASLTWYPWRQVGFGAQYTFTRFRYDRGLLVRSLSGEYKYDGLQLLVNVAF